MSAAGRRRESASRRRERMAFSAQDFLLGLAEGKQAVESMPVPTTRKARRVVLAKGR